MRIGAPNVFRNHERFNPRTRDGCEPAPREAGVITLVSIHAPVMGANLYTRYIFFRGFVSIHAPVMGAKMDYADGNQLDGVSIHAPVMGAKK